MASAPPAAGQAEIPESAKAVTDGARSAQATTEAAPKKKSKSRRGLKEHETLDDEVEQEDQEDQEDQEGSSSDDEETDIGKRKKSYPENESMSKDEVKERSPLGRFVRFNRKLGSGSYKVVYLGFDNDTGMEVAWNIISFQHMEKKAKKRISDEINMLKTLKHPKIIAFINAWTNKQQEQVCFITERITGGSLLQYIKRINAPLKLKVIRNWCRQILEGLNYLHTRPDPIIHRDLKCDNIFINGNRGDIVIGDLGLSTTLKQSCARSIVGTIDFIAPEIYDEKYGTAVDIYAFGMVLLEMIGREQPWSECETEGQVYKKVMAGEKPRNLRRVKDELLRGIIMQCARAKPDERPTAQQLLEHEWLEEPEGTSGTGSGNVLCELLPMDEAPEDVPDVDIFPQLPQLEKIAEEEEETEVAQSEAWETDSRVPGDDVTRPTSPEQLQSPSNSRHLGGSAGRQSGSSELPHSVSIASLLERTEPAQADGLGLLTETVREVHIPSPAQGASGPLEERPAPTPATTPAEKPPAATPPATTAPATTPPATTPPATTPPATTPATTPAATTPPATTPAATPATTPPGTTAASTPAEPALEPLAPETTQRLRGVPEVEEAPSLPPPPFSQLGQGHVPDDSSPRALRPKDTVEEPEPDPEECEAAATANSEVEPHDSVSACAASETGSIVGDPTTSQSVKRLEPPHRSQEEAAYGLSDSGHIQVLSAPRISHSERDFMAALRAVNEDVITECVINTKNSRGIPYEIKFDFDRKKDNVLIAAFCLFGDGSVDKGMGYEKLTVDIEHAVMKRCCQLAGLDEAGAAAVQVAALTMHQGAVQARTEGPTESAAQAAASKEKDKEYPEHEDSKVNWFSLGWPSAKYLSLSSEICKANAEKGGPEEVLKDQRDAVSLLQRSLAYLIPKVTEEWFATIGEWCQQTTEAVELFRTYHHIQSRGGVVDAPIWDKLSSEVKKKDEKEAKKKEDRLKDQLNRQQEKLQRKEHRNLESSTMYQTMMDACLGAVSNTGKTTTTASTTDTAASKGPSSRTSQATPTNASASPPKPETMKSQPSTPRSSKDPAGLGRGPQLAP
ncbi:unnamed protein product [Effrenium voratum]|nr:unnamed protein product [Effrenium voratum]